MEVYVKLTFCLMFIYTTTAFTNKFRKDYEYNEKTDAIYKLHTKGRKVNFARQICAAEGSKLMSHSRKEDIEQLLVMFNRFPDIGDVVWVDNEAHNHSAKVQPQDCDVVTRKGLIEMSSCAFYLPFICKMEPQNYQYDSKCGVYSIGYHYISSIGSCYKIPSIAYTWDSAYEECVAEGSHLLVLNSEAEHLAVKELLSTAPKIETAEADYFFHVGIHAYLTTDGTNKRIFLTVQNETLDEAGYSGWSDNEPNNYNNSEDCGTIFKNSGKYNDADCKMQYGFICENEVHLEGL